jgi:hypothetical protein
MDPKGRTPKAAEMAKRRRGPSAGDQPRRHEFQLANESMKGHSKPPVRRRANRGIMSATLRIYK